MDETAEQVIRKSKPKTDEPLNLLFTGHSAGAAVAELLFAFVHSNLTELSKIASGGFFHLVSLISPFSLIVINKTSRKSTASHSPARLSPFHQYAALPEACFSL